MRVLDGHRKNKKKSRLERSIVWGVRNDEGPRKISRLSTRRYRAPVVIILAVAPALTHWPSPSSVSSANITVYLSVYLIAGSRILFISEQIFTRMFFFFF